VDYLSDVDVVYSYDNPTKGTLSSVSGGFGSVSYEYNRRLQPVREEWIGGGSILFKRHMYGRGCGMHLSYHLVYLFFQFYVLVPEVFFYSCGYLFLVFLPEQGLVS